MRKILESANTFLERRQQLIELMPEESAVILYSLPESIRNGTVHNSFRQDSNLYYLTGFEEPGAIFVLLKGKTNRAILFVRNKNVSMETWEGFRFGPELAQKEFKLDEVYSIDDFEKQAQEVLKDSQQIYYRLNRHSDLDLKYFAILEKNKKSGFGLQATLDPEVLLGQLRVIKKNSDVIQARRACEISAEAHLEVMKYVRAGMNEREIHGYFIYQIFKRGASREGYGGIVAGGANACTLHYVFNDQILKKGDFLLIDCGGEYNYFTGDITRTYPVGGRFSEPQRILYQAVLDVQKQIIERVKPGVAFSDLQNWTIGLLVDVMLNLGFLEGSKEDIIKSKEFKKYYPHGVSHFLGMDVHDVGAYANWHQDSKLLEEGMIFTVEPGLYIPENDTQAPAEFRGLGVRIEDNILVTSTGYEVLTQSAPKEVADLEKLISNI